MKSIFRNLYIDAIGSFCSPSRGVHILNGHYINRFKNTDEKQFVSLLGKLRNYSEFLNIEDAVQLVKSGECYGFDGTAIAFTFDDGFKDCITSIAPALSEFNCNACFFINPGFIDGDQKYRDNFTKNVILNSTKESLEWCDVKLLNESGFIIGNHTRDHFRLIGDDKKIIQDQIFYGKKRIEDELNIKVDYFAWPFGQEKDINDYAIEFASSIHKYVFSGCNYRYYISEKGIINRRHFEADWKLSHIKYFLSFPKLHK